MKRLALILALLFAFGCATTAPPTPEPTPVVSPTPAPLLTGQAISSPSPTAVPPLTEQAVSSPTPAAALPLTSAATPVPAPASESMEPVDVVRSLMDAVEQLDAEAASEYFCAAQDIQFEDELKDGFGESEAMGLDPDELMAALMIDVKDMTYEEVSRGDTQAVVRMVGSMKVEFDAEELKAILKAAAEAQGQTISDEQAALFITMFNTMATQEFPLEGDVELIKENGKWVVCDDLDFLGEN